MSVWNPWRGCRRNSEGCKYCYIHKGDLKRGVDTNNIIKTDKFYAPVETNKSGEYKIKSGQLVYLCFSSDFLIEDADEWRSECWQMMRARSDLQFMFLTKRIERFTDCTPEDWGDGYDNVIVGCSVENQDRADRRLSVFDKLPIKHKIIVCQPMLEEINLTHYLDNVELVTVGGESDKNARPLDYSWVLSVREQCIAHNVNFEFRQCGTHFIKDGQLYTLPTRQLCSQARKANINYKIDDRFPFLLNKNIRLHYATFLDTLGIKKVPQLATLKHILTLRNIYERQPILRRRGQIVDTGSFSPLTFFSHCSTMGMQLRWTKISAQQKENLI